MILCSAQFWLGCGGWVALVPFDFSLRIFMVFVRASRSLSNLPDEAGAEQWPVSQGDSGG